MKNKKEESIYSYSFRQIDVYIDEVESVLDVYKNKSLEELKKMNFDFIVNTLKNNIDKDIKQHKSFILLISTSKFKIDLMKIVKKVDNTTYYADTKEKFEMIEQLQDAVNTLEELKNKLEKVNIQNG